MLNEDTKEYLKLFIRQTIVEEISVVLNSMQPVILSIISKEIAEQKYRGNLVCSMDLDMLASRLRHEFAENLQQRVEHRKLGDDDFRRKMSF